MFLYRIFNVVDGKQYVGITNNLNRRWKEHRNELQGNRHGNAHLQAAWNLYRKENFIFEVLSTFSDINTMQKAEVDFIAKNDLMNPQKGYNLDVGGAGHFKHSEEAKRKISQYNGESVVSMCLKTGEIREYNQIRDVMNDGLNPKSIANPCSDRALTYANRVWMYKRDYLKNPQILEKKRNERQNVKARPSRYRPVFGMNIKTKEIVKYEAVYHTKRDGLSHQSVNQCCVCPSVHKSHMGFVWSFNQDLLLELANKAQKGNINRKEIYKFSLNGQLVEKVDRNSISKTELKGILNVCSGKKLSYKGCLYSYNITCKDQKKRYGNFYRSFLKKDKDGNTIARYNNISELLNDNSQIKNTGGIYCCCQGKRKTAYGYKWYFGGGLFQ